MKDATNFTAPWRGPAVGGFSAGDYIENGFALWTDSYDNQSEADRAVHRTVPIQCVLTLAGSLESVVIIVKGAMITSAEWLRHSYP